MKGSVVVACLGVAVLCTGCNDDSGKSQQPSTGGGATSGSPAPAAMQQAAAASSGEHKRLPIGEAAIGGLKLVATMDEPVKPGSEGAFDVVISGGKPKAVRFWVGAENAEGSVKAKAEEETPDNWHTHAEVPDPLPPGSKFWVEVELPAGETFTRSFDLKVE